MGRSTIKTVDVKADGTGLSSRAGTALLALMAQRLGLTDGLCAAPERVVLDFDCTPIDVHSEKEHAAGHYKGGFGFNPLVVSCAREVLAGILRPGNAAAGNAADHVQALEQLPEGALDGEILARS